MCATKERIIYIITVAVGPTRVEEKRKEVVEHSWKERLRNNRPNKIDVEFASLCGGTNVAA